MANQQASDFQVGQRVRVTDGTPKPPAHHKRKVGLWNGRNFEGVVTRVEEPRNYAPYGSLGIELPPIGGWMRHTKVIPVGGDFRVEVIDEAVAA